jgi:hypothetical protein
MEKAWTLQVENNATNTRFGAERERITYQTALARGPNQAPLAAPTEPQSPSTPLLRLTHRDLLHYSAPVGCCCARCVFVRSPVLPVTTFRSLSHPIVRTIASRCASRPV